MMRPNHGLQGGLRSSGSHQSSLPQRREGPSDPPDQALRPFRYEFQESIMKRILQTMSCLLIVSIAALAFGQDGLVQVHNDFSKDPGWEWKSNRIVAQDPPTITQDFGWA